MLFDPARISGFLFRGATIAFIAQVLTVGFAFVERFVLTRVLGPEAFGEYTYVWSWASVLMFVGAIGMGTTSLRYVAKYAGQSQWNILKTFLAYSYRRSLVSSVLVSMATSALVWLLRDTLGEAMTITFLVASLLLPVMALAFVLSQQLLGMKQVLMAQVPTGFLRAFLLTLSVLLVVLVQPAFNAALVMGLNVVVVSLLLVLSYIYLQRSLPAASRTEIDPAQKKEWRRTANRFTFHDVLNIFNQRIDVLIIGLLLGTTQAGIFAVALALTVVLDLGITAINSIVAPIISEYYAQQKLGKLQRALTLSVTGVSLYALVLTPILVIFGERLLALFDPSFVEAYPALLLLLVGRVVHSMFGSTGYLVMMTAYEKESVQINFVSTVISTLLSFALLPLFGLSGAALVIVLRLTLSNYLKYRVVRKELKLEPTILSLPSLFQADKSG